MNKLFILDFDDTLFPTTYEILFLKYVNLDLTIYDNIFSWNQYNKISKLIKKYLSFLSQYGIVKIITNASNYWLNLCDKKYNIFIDNIDIISATELYKDKYAYEDCKKIAFYNTIKDIVNKGIKNLEIFFLGDDENDIIASMYICNKFKNINLKSHIIKFNDINIIEIEKLLSNNNTEKNKNNLINNFIIQRYEILQYIKKIVSYKYI